MCARMAPFRVEHPGDPRARGAIVTRSNPITNGTMRGSRMATAQEQPRGVVLYVL